jgi:hypothetical protein
MFVMITLNNFSATRMHAKCAVYNTNFGFFVYGCGHFLAKPDDICLLICGRAK